MKRAAVPALLLAIVPAALAAPAGTASGLFIRLPQVPHDAQSAYRQWTDSNGALNKGAAFKGLEEAITRAQMGATLGAAGSTHSAAQQQADAQKLKAQYDNPAARARMAQMSPAEAMAMAQQMQAQMGMAPPQMAAGPISEHDQALVKSVQPNPRIAMVRNDVAQTGLALGRVRTAYNADSDNLNKQQDAEIAKLPVCPGEAGDPSPTEVDKIMLKYADKRIALAAAYLPRYVPAIVHIQKEVGDEASYADRVYAAWSSLQSPSLRSMMQSQGRGAQANAIADVGIVLNFIEDTSKTAAQAVADKDALERRAAHAGGC